MKRQLMYIITMMTYRAWHPLVVIVLSHAYPSTINSKQLHELLALLDRTQREHFAIEDAADGMLGERAGK